MDRQTESAEIKEFVKCWIANPYAAEIKNGREVAAEKIEMGDSRVLNEHIVKLLGSEKKEDLLEKTLNTILAYGHYQVSNDDDANEPALDSKIKDLIKKFGTKYSDRSINLEGTIKAAGRCNRLLNPQSNHSLIFGNEDVIQNLRHDIWSACFGNNLSIAATKWHALRQENILILGETGTGKDYIAKIIAESAFKQDLPDPPPFKTLNAAALPINLLESELFGYVKGSFTGADKEKTGLIHAANNGIFFLDEIGELPLESQPKLLRAIEKGKIRKVGDTEETDVNVRFIAATNKDLAKMVKEGIFREDLFYRLAGLTLHTVPLRHLAEETIIEIGSSFVGKDKKERSEYHVDFVPKLIEYGKDHNWPGNARELRNVVLQLMLGRNVSKQSDQSLDEKIIPYPEEFDSILNTKLTLEELKEWYIFHCLKETQGNKSKAAKILGFDVSQFSRKYSYLKSKKGVA